MELALHDFFLSAREALEAWLTVTVVVAVAVVVLLLAAGWRQAHRSAARSGTPARSSQARDGSTGDLGRYAEEIAVAARRAGSTADQRRAEWLSALRNKEAVWRAYDAAETAAARVWRASAFPVSSAPLTDEEAAARRTYIHRIATEAYVRGALSTGQLHDILAQRNGWGAHSHPFELETAVRRAARDGLLRAYQTATTMEREAWQALETATAARLSLDTEARAAALRARQGERGPVVVRQRRPVTTPVVRPTGTVYIARTAKARELVGV